MNKTEQVLIRLSPSEMNDINEAWRDYIIASREYTLTRSEFIRRLIAKAIEK